MLSRQLGTCSGWVFLLSAWWIASVGLCRPAAVMRSAFRMDAYARSVIDVAVEPPEVGVG